MAAKVQQVLERTGQPRTVDAAFELGNFVVYLWVGLTRYWRGEQLSSHKYVTQFALDSLLEVVADVVVPVNPETIGAKCTYTTGKVE